MQNMKLTCSEGISLVISEALTHGVVVEDMALGVGAARSGTRRLAMVFDTGQVFGTILVSDTFVSRRKSFYSIKVKSSPTLK